MKKLMGILLAASMVFSLAACGSTADTAASSAAASSLASFFPLLRMTSSPSGVLLSLIPVRGLT